MSDPVRPHTDPIAALVEQLDGLATEMGDEGAWEQNNGRDSTILGYANELRRIQTKLAAALRAGGVDQQVTAGDIQEMIREVNERVPLSGDARVTLADLRDDAEARPPKELSDDVKAALLLARDALLSAGNDENVDDVMERDREAVEAIDVVLALAAMSRRAEPRVSLEDQETAIERTASVHAHGYAMGKRIGREEAACASSGEGLDSASNVVTDVRVMRRPSDDTFRFFTGWTIELLRLSRVDALRLAANIHELVALPGAGDGLPQEELCAGDAHLFGPCQTCGMPYLASRFEPPTDDDIAWAKRVLEIGARAVPPSEET